MTSRATQEFPIVLSKTFFLDNASGSEKYAKNIDALHKWQIKIFSKNGKQQGSVAEGFRPLDLKSGS